MLSEINQRQELHDINYMWNLEKKKKVKLKRIEK